MPEVVKKSSKAAKRTAPNCARCKNHGIKNILSGHKRYCLYLECKCVKCMSTVERQRTMAKNTAQRRAEKQHQKKMDEWRSMVEKARQNGEQLPPEPAELLSPILSPKIRSSISDYGSSERNYSPGSDSSRTSPDLIINDSRSSVASLSKGKSFAA